MFAVHAVKCLAAARPLAAIFVCYVTMGLGTMLGSWRIVHAMGSKITKLSPLKGACAGRPALSMRWGLASCIAWAWVIVLPVHFLL